MDDETREDRQHAGRDKKSRCGRNGTEDIGERARNRPGQRKCRNREQKPQNPSHSDALVVEDEHQLTRENAPIPTGQRLDKFPIGVEPTLLRPDFGDLARLLADPLIDAVTLLCKATHMAILRIRETRPHGKDAEEAEDEKEEKNAMDDFMEGLAHLWRIFYDYSRTGVKSIWYNSHPMKKRLFSVSILAILVLVAGCFSMESASMRLDANGKRIHVRASGGIPSQHVVISNSGWYLFNALPVVCGNAHEDAWFEWRFFSDEVDLDLLHNRLTRHAARAGCLVEGLNVFNSELVLLEIPGTEFPLPLPYIITYREMQISCVLTEPVTGDRK